MCILTYSYLCTYDSLSKQHTHFRQGLDFLLSSREGNQGTSEENRGTNEENRRHVGKQNRNRESDFSFKKLRQCRENFRFKKKDRKNSKF